MHALRDVPRAVKADPQLFSTGILFADNEQRLADPCGVTEDLFGSPDVPDRGQNIWREECSAWGHECELCPGVDVDRRVPGGFTWSAVMESWKGVCVRMSADA